MNRFTSILTALSFAFLFFAASAHAQNEQRMVVNIPFEFTVVGHSLPAGQYEFLRVADGFVLLRDANGHSLIIRASAAFQRNGAQEKSELRFANVDGHHVLIQTWNDNSGSGNEFSYERPSVQPTNPEQLTEQ